MNLRKREALETVYILYFTGMERVGQPRMCTYLADVILVALCMVPHFMLAVNQIKITKIHKGRGLTMLNHVVQ